MRPSPSQLQAFLKELRLSDRAVVTDPVLLASYATDRSGAPPAQPDLLLRPKDASEVQDILRAASAHRVPITPRGAGTGKAGGALPVHGGAVLSLERMNRLLELRPADLLVVTQPGVITGAVMAAAEAEGLFYPPDPNSFEQCSIGGNVACNAGGPRALKYGVTRNYVLQLEAVLADGRRLRVGRRTQKQAAGYPLAQLLVGSEGTLAVITEISLKLLPRPRGLQTALLSFTDVRAAAEVVSRLLSAGVQPACLELLDHHALAALAAQDAALLPAPEGSAAGRVGAMFILETDGDTEAEASARLQRAAELALDAGALDVRVAQSPADRARIWAPRRGLSDALKATAHGKISEDVTVPRSRLPALVEAAERIGEAHQVRVACYGHAGDGNLHVNLLFEARARPRAEAAAVALMEATVALEGTISGEHGIGSLKRALLPLEQPPALIGLQRALKQQLDPAGVLNPGKILP